MNDFQQLMRRWAALAPYNAGHIMRVSGPPDVDRWQAALTPVLATLGITEPLAIEVSTLDFDDKITEELNRPFPSGALPLRAFVLTAPNSHLFGVIYDHWFADSPSLRALMRRVFESYSSSVANLPPLRVATDCDTSQRAGLVRNFSAFFSSLRNYQRHRRAHRIHLRDPLDFRTGFFSMRFPNGAISQMRTFAKKHGATVNDMFVAAASQTLGNFTAEQRKSKRDGVGIATAVDLKPLPLKNLDNVFGFFVGYFTVVHDRPELRSLDELVAATAHESSVAKNAARVLPFNWSLRVVRWLWDRSISARSKAQLFQKGLPLLAGISNVNLTGTWADQETTTSTNRAMLLDYLRISPVGPLLPLVFTLTTIHDRLSLCVTYRTTAFSRLQAERIAADFISRLNTSTTSNGITASRHNLGAEASPRS